MVQDLMFLNMGTTTTVHALWCSLWWFIKSRKRRFKWLWASRKCPMEQPCSQPVLGGDNATFKFTQSAGLLLCHQWCYQGYTLSLKGLTTALPWGLYLTLWFCSSHFKTAGRKTWELNCTQQFKLNWRVIWHHLTLQFCSPPVQSWEPLKTMLSAPHCLKFK